MPSVARVWGASNDGEERDAVPVAVNVVDEAVDEAVAVAVGKDVAECASDEKE